MKYLNLLKGFITKLLKLPYNGRKLFVFQNLLGVQYFMVKNLWYRSMNK